MIREIEKMDLAQYFAVRVISLPHCQDRQRLVSENLREFPFAWEFFRAFTANADFPLNPHPDRQLARYGRLMSSAEIGCFKSHFAVLGTFQSSPKLQWLLVLEDDVWLDTGFPFSEIIEILKDRNIEYLRLFAREYKPADVILNLTERQIIRFRTDPYGTQAYLISRSGAERFIATVSSIDMPIDDEFGRFWRHGLGLYSVFPFPVVERTGSSSIQAERDTVSMNSLPLVRHLHRVGDWVAKAIENLRYRIAGR